MTRPDDLDLIRTLLQRQRHALVSTHLGAQRELSSLQEQERDPEYEESAQTATAEFTLVQLTDGQRRQLEQIDAAIDRIDAGTYGICVDCETEIPPERLSAVPYSLRCADCATAREGGPRHNPISL